MTYSSLAGLGSYRLNLDSMLRSWMLVTGPAQTSSFEYTLNYPSFVNMISVGWNLAYSSMMDPMMISYLKLYAGCLHKGHSHRGLTLEDVNTRKLFKSKH
jgi:hypothetical protein